MKTIDRQDVQRCVGDGEVTVAEVLERSEYDEMHLPGAISLPLNSDFEIRLRDFLPDKSRKVVLYGRDRQCELAHKAAQRMEQLGYAEVSVYPGGKADWQAAGLELER